MMKLCWDLVSTNEQWVVMLRSRILKDHMPISHHISSSVWSGLKPFISSVSIHSRWILGNGCSINFWKDRWLSSPIVDFLQIPVHLHKHLNALVKDFIKDSCWTIPQWLLDSSSDFARELKQVFIPIYQAADELVWSGNDSGVLSLKEAYDLVHGRVLTENWPKFIWSKAIPPSKSFLLWRLLHHKVPTDDILWRKRCHIVSMCSLCGCNYETSDHLFLYCSFAKRIWSWLSSKLALQIDPNSVSSIMSVLQFNWKTSNF